MIFKTIDDNDSLSGQRIVSKFTARKIAQEEATKQLEIDIQCLRNYEAECQKGSVSTETFNNTMKGASVEAQKYAVNIKEGTGSAQTFATNQRTIQASMSETSIVSKVAATGLSIFKAALNSLIFFAVIEGIQLLIKGIDNLILTADEAEEKAEALRGNMQSFFDEVQSGQQTISSVSDRFSELSEHVTKTGENIDLTKDEYSEYLDICNQVKTIMPELVTGYTNEGNAIITLKDNVDSLTESYKENIKAKAASFITNGDDDGNTIQSFFDDYDIFTNGENGLFAPSAGGLWNNKSTDYEDYYGYDKVHEWLSDVSEMSLKDLQNLQKGTTEATYLYALLKENGYELANITEDDYNAVHDVLTTRLTSLEGEMTTRVSNIKMSLQQMLYADGDYWNIDDKEALSALDSFFASIDDEFIKQNNLLSQTALQSFESNAVDLFQNKSTKQSMIDIFNPQGEDESIKDYTTRVENAISEIQKYCDENGITIPFNFGTEDDPKGVQKTVDDLQKSYDDAISSAKEKYSEDLTPFFEENSINTQEEIDKWNEVAASCDTATEAKKKYLGTDASEETPVSFKKAWAGLDNNEDYKNTKKEVLELAEAGKLTDETFAKADGGNAKKYFDSMNIGVEEAVKKINATVDAVKQLSSLKTGITSLRDAYTEKKESKNNVVGSDTLGKLEDEFGNLGKAWTNYKKIAGSSKRNLKDLSSAQNQLAQAYLNSNNFLSNLVDKTGKYDESVRQLYISQLKDMGVKNAEEVVDSEISRQLDDAAAGYAALSEQQRETITSTSELKDKTADALIQLYLEATGSEEAKNALLRLSLINTNWEDLDATETYNQLIKIAEAAGIATGTIKGLQDLKLVAPDISSGNSLEYLNNTVGNSLTTGGIVTNPFDPNNKKTTTKTKKQATNEAYNDLLKKLGGGNSTVKVKIEMPNVSTAPTGGGGKGGGGKNSSSDSKTQFDWIERRITNLQTRFDRWKTIIENSSLKFIDKYYKKATSYAKKLVNTEGSAYTKYMKKANGVKLNKSLKAKVRNGKISGKTSDLIKEYGSKTADKIQKYQDYYEKATSALDSFISKANELYNLPLDKAAAKIEKFNDSIELLELKLDNAIGATNKNKIIDSEETDKNNIVKANKTAKKTANKNFNSTGRTLKKNLGGSGLSKKEKSAVKKAIKNGKEVNLAMFKEGSKGYKAAIKYNSALLAKEKAQNTYDTSKEELTSWKRTSAYNKFENIQTDYENQIGLIDAKIQELDDSIANIEASGATVDNSWYKSKKTQVNDRKKILENEKKALQSALASIPQGTEEWHKANDEINKVNSSIAECTKTQYELNDAIAEGNKKILENKMNGIQDIIDEEDFLLGLIEHEDSVDSETGVRTNAGNTRLRSYSIDYYASQNKVSTVTKELERLQNMKKNKQYGADYEYSSLEALDNAIKSVIKSQRDEITSLYGYEKKIVEEMKNAYQSQYEVLQKLINKKKENLEAEKDLHDYQKQIKEKTKNIDTIRKQIAAYQGDTSEEAKAQLQKLQVSLNEAKDDLKDTEYDRYISDQSKMLDNLQKEYQEWMEKHIKNFEDLLKEGLGIGKSADGSYLHTIAKNNGYNISNTDANKNGNVKTNVDNQTNKNGNIEPVKLSTSTISTKPSSSSSATKTKSDKTKAKEYIKKNKSKSKKPLREYSYVNQKIAALTKDKHGTYVLSTSHLKGLAKLLNVTTDGNYTKSGKLAKKLKSIGLAGFSQGGVVSVHSLNKQVRANGDDGLASVKNGEAILTPAQTEMFKQFVQSMQNYPSNIKLPNTLTNLSKTIPNNIDYGGVSFNFELNNVTNGDEFIREIQKNQKLQKAIQSVSIDKINGGGRLSVNRIK